MQRKRSERKTQIDKQGKRQTEGTEWKIDREMFERVGGVRVRASGK